MAMRRDRENRYQSAFGLSQDIQRFIDGDAVVATRPGLGYQFKIFARKNKAVIGLVAAAFVVLLIGGITSTSLFFKVEKERQIAEVAKQKATEGQQFLSDVRAVASSVIISAVSRERKGLINKRESMRPVSIALKLLSIVLSCLVILLLYKKIDVKL